MTTLSDLENMALQAYRDGQTAASFVTTNINSIGQVEAGEGIAFPLLAWWLGDLVRTGRSDRRPLSNIGPEAIQRLERAARTSRSSWAAFWREHCRATMMATGWDRRATTMLRKRLQAMVMATHHRHRHSRLAATVNENPFHADCSKLLRRLREAEGPTARHHLLRAMHCKAVDLGRIVSALVQQGSIVLVKIPTKTKTAQGYRLS